MEDEVANSLARSGRGNNKPIFFRCFVEAGRRLKGAMCVRFFLRNAPHLAAIHQLFRQVEFNDLASLYLIDCDATLHFRVLTCGNIRHKQQ